MTITTVNPTITAVADQTEEDGTEADQTEADLKWDATPMILTVHEVTPASRRAATTTLTAEEEDRAGWTRETAATHTTRRAAVHAEDAGEVAVEAGENLEVGTARPRTMIRE